MRPKGIQRRLAAWALVLALAAVPVLPVLAQDGSPVAGTPSPAASLDPEMVAGTSIPFSNEQRTGEVHGEGIVGNPSILWSQPMDTESGWLTAAGDGIVVVETVTELRVLDRATGEPLWAVPFEPSSGDPLLDGGVIYTTSIAGATAYDAATGATIWTFEPALEKEENPDFPLTELDGAPLKLGDTIYVSSTPWGGVYALDSATGSELWRFDTKGDVPGSIAAQDGVLYFTADAIRSFPESEGEAGALWAVDAETGNELWNIPLGTGVQAFSTVTVAGGKAIFSVYNDDALKLQILAYDLATKELAWSAAVPVLIFDAALAVSDGLVFVPLDNSTGVFALDLETGALVWEHITAETALPSPAVADGVLYVQTTLPSLEAIDAKTGGFIWSLSLGEPSNIGTWGVRLSDGTAFVDTGDTVVAVTGDGGAMPPVTGSSDYPEAAAVASDADAYFGSATLLQPDEPFAGPQGVAVAPSGEVFVVDAQNNRIQIFNADLSPKQIWGEAGDGDGQFQFLWEEQGRFGGDVDFGADGTIYVSDMANSRIQVFDKDLTFRAAWPLEAEHTVDRPLPTGIAIDEERGRLFIGDWDSNHVLVYDLDGNKLSEWGVGGPDDPVRFAEAFDIVVGAGGTVYIADSRRMRIRTYSPGGEPIASFGGFGTDPGRFDGVTSLALDADGNLYTTDYLNRRVQVFSPEGEVIGIWNAADSGLEGFARLWSVAVGPDGRVYVVDEDPEGGGIAVLTTPAYIAPEGSPAAPVASPAT